MEKSFILIEYLIINNMYNLLLEKKIEEIIEICFNYVNKSRLVEKLLIYCSTELMVYFDVLFEVKGTFYERHKIDFFLNKQYINMTQKELILTSNKKINEIILLCAENNITVPNEIKIKLIDFVFEKHLNDKSALDDSAEKWFNEYKYSRR